MFPFLLCLATLGLDDPARVIMAGTVPIRGLPNRFKRKIFIIKLGPDTMLKHDTQRYGGDDGYAIFAYRTYDPNNDSAMTESSSEQVTDIEDIVQPEGNREDPPYCDQIGGETVSMLSVSGRPGTPDPRSRIKTFAGKKMEYWGSSTTLEEVADVINTAKADKGDMSAADMDNDELMTMVALGLTFTETDKKKLADLLNNIYEEEESTESHKHQNLPARKEGKSVKRANTTPVSTLEDRSEVESLSLSQWPRATRTPAPTPRSAPRNIPGSGTKITTTRGDTSNVTIRSEMTTPDGEDSWEAEFTSSQQVFNIDWDAETSIHVGDGAPTTEPTGSRAPRPKSSTGPRAPRPRSSTRVPRHLPRQRTGSITSITSLTSLQGDRVTDLYTTEGAASLDPLGVVLLPRGEPQAGARSNKRAKRD